MDNDQPSFYRKKSIDLSLPMKEGMRGVHFEVAKRLDTDGWNARNLHLYSHAGTHVDAPVHFGIGRHTIDAYSPDQLMGPAWVARLSPVRDRELITPADLGSIADELRPGDSLLLHTGWSAHHGTARYRDRLPRVSQALAEWCVARKVKMLGVEPPSVADPNDLEEVTRIHRILFKGEVIIVEGLTNLEALRGNRVWFMALPLKIHGGDGAPARALAFELE